MRIWKRLLNIALCLCLCLCADLLPVTAQAAAALPVIEIGTSGDTYQYAKSGVNLSQLAYGTVKAETPISTAASETGNVGTRFTLDTGWNRNFKLIYKEIPVKVTVPAKTEYTVTFRYSFDGNYHYISGKTTAAFSAQAMYLGEKGAASDLMFHTAAGGTVKTTRNGSTVANIHTAKRVGSNAPVETPGSSNGSVFTASFQNTDSKAQAVTRYFGVWAASGDNDREPTSLTLNFTLMPVTVTYTVKLDPNGGNVSPASKQVTLGGQYGELPTPTRAGFTFIGWYTTAKTGGTKVGRYDSLVSAGSHILYARWSQNHTHEAVPGGGDKTFTAKDSVPTSNTVTGNYYLTQNQTISSTSKQIWMSGNYLALCLNGKTITVQIKNGAIKGDQYGPKTIYICDCQGSGEIVSEIAGGYVLGKTRGYNLYLYGGTFKGAIIRDQGYYTLVVDGAALYATDTAIIAGTYVEATIKSGIVSSSGNQAVQADADDRYYGVYVRGGTIENTGNGCAIRVGAGKTVHLSGSPIITGKSCDFLLEKDATVTVDGALTGVFSVGLDDPATVTAGTPVTIAVGKDGGDPTGHFVLPDTTEYENLYLQNGTDTDGNKIVQVCRHTHSGGKATCTEWGTCTQSQCGKAYIKPLGHNIVKHDGKDPTCTATGWWAYETCSRCNYTTYQEIPASGHKYGALVAEKPATCTAEGMRAHYQCADCNKYFDAGKQETTPDKLKIPLAAHQYGDFTVDKPATCTEAGSKSRHCSRCDAKTDETVIPATEHTPVIDAAVAPTCTKTGLTEGKPCSVCNTVLTPQTTVEKLPHSWDDGVVTREPTCTEEGVKTFTCSQCHNTKTEPIPALDHDWGEWVVTIPATEEMDGSKTRTCQRDSNHTETQTIPKLNHTHNMEYHPAVDADCGKGTAGNIEYWVCSGCNKVFSDAGGANEIDLDKTVIHPAHDLNTDWSHDESNHWHACQKCGQQFGSEAHKYDDDSDTDCNTCGYIRTITPPHTHSLTLVPAVPATCVSAGNIEHYRCEVCGERFRDDEGNEPVTEAEVKLSPLGHAPSRDWSYDASGHWHECQNNCGEKLDFATHVYDGDSDATCNTCDYTRTITPPHTHSLTLVLAVPATCASAGNIEHYRCTDCDKLFSDSSGTRELTAADVTTAKLPHTPETIPAVPATCEQSGMTEGSKCSVCQEVITAQTTIPALNHDWQEATCETPKFCKRDGCGVTEGAALGHDWGRYIVTTPATQESEGEETRTCRRNDAHKQTRTIPKLPASTYGVSGEVHESDDKPAVGVKVTLVLGDRLIDSTKTDDKGKYSFGNVAPGVYNLVAERGGIIMTIKVEVVSEDVAVSPIIMPQGKTNSVVEVKSDKPEENVEAVVGNLETVFETVGEGKPFTDEDQAVVNGGGSVEIKLTVTKTDTGATSNAIKKQLSDKTKVGVRLKLEVSKTVTETNGNSKTTPVTDTDVLLETIIRLPAALQGKDSYTVYRLHGAVVHALTAEKNTDGEYIEVSPDKTAITIHAKLYSEYVIAYQERGETGGSGGNGGNGGNTGGNTGNDNGGGHDDRDDGYTPPSVPAPPETHTGYRACRRDDACPIWPFADAAPTAWYHDGVHYCVEKGLMHGISADKFLPDGSVTRAQLAAILWRLEGNPAPVSAAGFSDVADGAWYAGAVRWAADSGVVMGYADGRFRPNDAVTREQMAALLYRFAGYKGYDVGIGGDTDILRFVDGAAVGGYAVPAMRWACGSGLMTGAQRDGGMALAPRDTTTRAQTATLLTRFQSAFAKEP